MNFRVYDHEYTSTMIISGNLLYLKAEQNFENNA